MRRILAIACIIGLSIIPFHAFASAWTQDQGNGQAILSYNFYYTDSYWDNRGNRQSQPAYLQDDFRPYLEYGLWDGVTVGTNLSFQVLYQDHSAINPSQTSWGLGDSEFFVRKRLWQQDGFVVSAQPMVKLPSPTDTMPKLGGSSPDIGLGLSGGYGFKAWGLDDFADIDTQYRHRYGTPKDQVNLAGTLGVSVAQSWMVMPQLFLTYRTATPNYALFTNSSADDYNLVKLQLSIIYKATNNTWLQLGGFDNVSGRNTGGGEGAVFGVWNNF